MKRIIVLFLTVLLATTAAFAKSENDIVFDGVGLSAPIINQKITDDGSRQLFSSMLDFYTLAANKDNGLTWQFDIAVGYTTSKDIPFYDNEKKHGIGLDCEMGFGYSFIRTDDVIFSLLGTFGLTTYSFSGDKTFEYNDMKFTDSEVFGLCWNLGLEGIFVKSLSEKLSFFGALSARWIWSADEESKYSVEKDDVTYSYSMTREAKYGLAVVPKIGLLWKM